MKSIRAKLALWLVGAMCAGIVLVLVTAYILVRIQIGRAFDAELALVAKAVHLREDWMEAGRLRIARPGFFFAVRAYDGAGDVYFETRLPEIPPDIPQLYQEGYRLVDTSEGTWRLYTFVTPEGNVQVGQPVATRDALARELSLRMLAPMLLLIPILGALVPWALNRGLRPLRDISHRVGARDATLLDPLPTEDVPDELLPLIEQINGLLTRLDASFDAQRAFLADAAHDLRSPVAALALQAQIAERAPRPSARVAAFSELRRGIDRAARLVQQLLDFARLEPGVPSEPAGTVDIAQMIRELVGAYSGEADEVGVDLGADTPHEAKITGVEIELRSMLANLVDNALRYAPRSSVVTVSARCLDSAVEIRVVDGGPGIPPGERDRVFDRFHRVPGDTRAGSGLGLSIVKAIVERHRGTLVLRDANRGSQPPGLEVYIRLPAAEPARPVATSAS